MFPFLNMVPDQLIFEPRDLFLRELCIGCVYIMNRKPLSAFAADNGFRVAIGRVGRHFP